MNKKPLVADQNVDALYTDLRNKYGEQNSRANGYLWHGYFRREQELLLKLVSANARIIVDVACGSGLMLEPLLNSEKTIIGIDFNSDACQAATKNGLATVRGDAFRLPFAENSIDEIVTCQFFNQQSTQAVEKFIQETQRVLRPGGRVIMIWRNGEAYVHSIAQFMLTTLNRIRKRANFPYENHSFKHIQNYARDSSLIVEVAAVSFPPLRWMSYSYDSVLAKFIGASSVCVLAKPTA